MSPMKNGATPFKAYVSFGYDISFENLYNNFHMTVLYLELYLKVTYATLMRITYLKLKVSIGSFFYRFLFYLMGASACMLYIYLRTPKEYIHF